MNNNILDLEPIIYRLDAISNILALSNFSSLDKDKLSDVNDFLSVSLKNESKIIRNILDSELKKHKKNKLPR